MRAGDLTTLAHVKEWLGISNDDSDVLLQRLITSASKFVLNYLNRPGLAVTTYEDIYDTYGKNWLQLRQWPVVSVTQILFSGNTVNTPASGNPLNNGYLVGNQSAGGGPASGQPRLTVFGYCFPNAKSSTVVQYSAGYQITNEPQTVPADTAYTVTTDFTWLADGGVTLANGTPLTAVASSPGAMQYSVNDDGVYTFNAAQASADVLITYSYVPADVEQAVWELVGERYKTKDRIGVQSKSLGGQETISYFTGTMNSYVSSLLQVYRRVVPT